MYRQWPNFGMEQESSSSFPQTASFLIQLKWNNLSLLLSLADFRFSKPAYFFTCKEHHKTWKHQPCQYWASNITYMHTERRSPVVQNCCCWLSPQQRDRPSCTPTCPVQNITGWLCWQLFQRSPVKQAVVCSLEGGCKKERCGSRTAMV